MGVWVGKEWYDNSTNNIVTNGLLSNKRFTKLLLL